MAKGDGASAYARRNERARAEGYRSYYEKRTVEAVARGKSLAVARGHGRGEYHRDHVRIIHAQAGRRGQVFRVRQYEVGNPQIDNERSRATPVSADTLLLAIKRYVGTKPGFVRVAVYGIFDYRANARVLRWAGFAMPRREALDQLTEIRDAVEQERVLRAIALRGGMPRPLTKAEHTRLESQVRTVENRLLAEWVSSHLNVYGVDEHNRPISATPCERVFAVSVAPSFAYLPQEPDDDDTATAAPPPSANTRYPYAASSAIMEEESRRAAHDASHETTNTTKGTTHRPAWSQRCVAPHATGWTRPTPAPRASPSSSDRRREPPCQ